MTTRLYQTCLQKELGFVAFVQRRACVDTMQYTVTMFVIDVGPSMGQLRTHDPDGNELPQEITNLQWGLQFVKLKIQEMVCISWMAV